MGLMKKYEVLVSCRRVSTKKSYKPGDIITGKDFPAAIIKEWLEQDQPVLKEVADGGNDKR